MNKALALLTIILFTDFVFNGWAGISIYSDKELNYRLSEKMVMENQQVTLSRIEHSLFGVIEPVLVFEESAESQLQDADSLAEAQDKIRTLSIKDISVYLVATSNVQEKKQALLELGKGTTESDLVWLTEGDDLLENLQLVNVASDHVEIRPILNDEIESDFQSVKLYLYKPGNEKEIL